MGATHSSSEAKQPHSRTYPRSEQTAKTPAEAIRLAKRRLREWERRGE